MFDSFRNVGKLADLERSNEIYRERNKQLEGELARYKDIELKFKIAQMLVDDDPAIDELFECALKIERDVEYIRSQKQKRVRYV